MLDPHDRQRLYDIRHAHPTLRRRLLRYHCKNRAGIESLIERAPEQTPLDVETDQEANKGTQDTAMEDFGDTNQEDGKDGECLPTTPSKIVGKVFENLNISEPATDHAS